MGALEEILMPYGAGSPAEMAQQPSGLAKLLSGAYEGLGSLAKRAFGASEEMRGGGAYNARPALEAALLPMGTGAIAGVPMRAGEAVLGAGPIRHSVPLAIKDAVEAAAPAGDMVRLYRGGGNNQGGPKWVTTSRKYAEGYTTPGLAHNEGPGSFLQYVDIPASDARVRMPAGQSTHSFEAPPDIADQLRPYYSSRAAQGSRTAGEGDDSLVDILKKYGIAGVPAAGAFGQLMQEQRS